MSRTTAVEEPRRGSRARKVVDRYDPGGDTGKGRRRSSGDEDSDEELTSEEEEEGEEEEERRPLKNNKRAANGVKKNTGATTSSRAKTTSGKKKTSKTAAEGADGGENGPSGPAELKTDSPFFNALLSPDIALNTVIEEWVENYQASAGDEISEQAAVLELILFCVRCCGLSAELDEDEVMDTDGVVDVLERIQDESVKTSLAAYPLINRTKTFRSFRQNLNLFIPKLIKTLSETPILYEKDDKSKHSTPLIPLLLHWLHSMSSSPLRPIRHTSTYLALKINSALCDVVGDVTKELSLRQRQKEAESKKGNSTAIQKKVKEAEKKVKEAHERKQALEEHMKEINDVMFVHRVRDSDVAIRSDCIRELGVWIKSHGERYAQNKYLICFIRGCNDPDSHGRLETVKALSSLYATETFANKTQGFSLRVVPRLVEMALRDVELSVRVNAVNVITKIDKSGLLADDESGIRDNISKLVFDQEPKIRKAIGGFMQGLWEERVGELQAEIDKLKGARKKKAATLSEEDMAGNLEWKALAQILVQTSMALDEEEEEGAGGSKSSTEGNALTTRANAAVEALEGSEKLEDWQSLVDYLMLDHSTADDDLWLLESEEEDFMLQILIACIKHGENDEEKNSEKTKTLIKVLPNLFTTHQADVHRVAGILSIIEHMNLSLYLDMRMSAAYDSLWEDVTKQFLNHTSPSVLEAAIKAINHLSANASMSASNTTHLQDLIDSVFTSLRDALKGEEVADLALDEDQITSLQAILLRINLLCRSRDLVSVMEDEEGGQSSAWDIIGAFAERGDVGFKEESKIVEYAIQTVFLHITWLFKQFTENDISDEAKVEGLKQKRDRAVHIFQNRIIGHTGRPAETVRRQAFISFLNLHVLFNHRSSAPAAKAAPLQLADDLQHRLGGAFQAAIEKFTSEEEVGEESNEDQEKTQQRFAFYQLVSVVVAAIRIGVLDVDHAKEPLAHYGRLGATYDAIVKKLVDVLRDEGIYNRESETVQQVAMHALQTSFSLFLDSEEKEPTASLTLARLIENAFIIRGPQFTTLKTLHPREVVDFHIACIDWICARIASFVKQEKANKNQQAKSRLQLKRYMGATFFRTLILLLGPLGGRDALKVKGHLQVAIEKIEAPISGNKAWDAYRSYEKRLIGIASRDTAVTNASRNVVATQQTAGGARVGVDKGKKRAREASIAEEEEEEGSASPAPESPSKSRRVNGHSTNTVKVTPNGGGNDERENEDLEEEQNRDDEPQEDHNGEENEEEEQDQDGEEAAAGGVDLPMLDDDIDMNLDLDNEDLSMLEGPIRPRDRSASIEPLIKKRKVERRW